MRGRRGQVAPTLLLMRIGAHISGRSAQWRGRRGRDAVRLYADRPVNRSNGTPGARLVPALHACQLLAGWLRGDQYPGRYAPGPPRVAPPVPAHRPHRHAPHAFGQPVTEAVLGTDAHAELPQPAVPGLGREELFVLLAVVAPGRIRHGHELGQPSGVRGAEPQRELHVVVGGREVLRPVDFHEGERRHVFRGRGAALLCE